MSILTPLAELTLNAKNPRLRTEDGFKKLLASLIEFPEMLHLRPVVADEVGLVLGGNMRTAGVIELRGWAEQEKDERIESAVAGRRKQLLSANPKARTLEAEDAYRVALHELFYGSSIPAVRALGLTAYQKQEFIIKDNATFGDWDWSALATDDWPAPDVVKMWGVDGPDGWGQEPAPAAPALEAVDRTGSLAARFLVPPFSILDTRQGYWQERKGIWRARIGDQGESREGTLRRSASADDPSYYRLKEAAELKVGRVLTNEEFQAEHYVRTSVLPVGVSLLDPVLAELVVKWFGLAGGAAFDCFAGDSVFGFVAAATGMSFTGVELRPEQATLNQQRTDSEGLPARYICDDGRHVGQHLAPASQDLLFSCPPYYDLEVYSDNPADASNQGTYAEFLDILATALRAAAGCLKENRFAVITVGDVREAKTSAYYGFPADIVAIMRGAGLHYYNELILVEQAGNAAIRAGNQMKHRKPVKTHQQVLVFYKGDPRQIKNHFPDITYEPEDLESLGLASDDLPATPEG